MGNNLLKGKKGIIFGALNPDSIAWKVAERAHEEGATVTLSNVPVALRMGRTHELAEKIGAEVIGADATNVDDLNNLILKSMEVLGGKVASRRRKSKASRANRDEKLASLIDRRYALKGWRDGYEYRASLRKDGTIRYGDKVFESPFQAASEAVGRRINGWQFWHYRDERSGNWLPLMNLRQ